MDTILSKELKIKIKKSQDSLEKINKKSKIIARG
jgi:hypothetical protein